MRIKKPITFLAVAIILIGNSGWAEQNGPIETEKSCLEFVKTFYEWYAARAFTPSNGWLDSSLRDRPSSFAPGLLSALGQYKKAPSNAQAGSDNFDFDPFLNAQDTAERYDVESVERKGGSFFVEVYSVSSGKKKNNLTSFPN